MKKRLLLGTALVFGLGSNMAMAVPTYYSDNPTTDRAAFQTAAGPLSLESFEGGSVASTTSFNFGDFTLTSSSDPFSVGNGSSSFATDGSAALFSSEGGSANTFTFTFNSAINAFGIDVNDLNFSSLSFSDNLGNTLNNALLPDNGGPAGGVGFTNLQFFGVTNSNGFTSVSLTVAGGSSGGIAFDRLEYTLLAPPPPEIPEPMTLALFGLGLAGTRLAWTMYRTS